MINEFELQNLVIDTTMLGENANLYHCLYDGNKYIYKKLNDFNNEILKKLLKLMEIKSTALNIPSYIIYNKDKPTGYLIEPLLDYQVLFNLQWFDINKRIKILKKAKEQIIEMHKYGIVHCDLHSANMMFNKNNDVKIIDFDSCFFDGIKPDINSMNANSYRYLLDNKISNSLDIFVFNITTISILYKIAYDDILKPKFQPITESKLVNDKQKEIWQKVKQKKELTYNDFLIDYY